MLHFYASKLPAVEINNTFYRLPKASILESWADQVPEGFRFAIKASRRITHFKRLKDTGDETAYLLETLQALGQRLGVVLFQLPPNLKKDLPRLQGFLDLLSAATGRAVFEFRHASWFDDEVLDCLREPGSAVCVSDADEEAATEVIDTTNWGYLRLRRAHYSPDELSE